MNKDSLKGIFLPKWKPWTKSNWTWQRISLLLIAGIVFVDSFFIPLTRDVDPGRSAEGILFLIIGFRAVSRDNPPPTSIVIGGACLAGLTAACNHLLLKSPSWIWTPTGLILLAFVLFWGRSQRADAEKDQIAR